MDGKDELLAIVYGLVNREQKKGKPSVGKRSRGCTFYTKIWR